MNEPLRLGERLVRKGLVSDEQLEHALQVQQQTNESLGDILLQQEVVEESELLKVLVEHFGVPLVSASDAQLDRSVAALLPEDQARQMKSVLLKKDGESYVLVMLDPSDIFVIDGVEQILGGAQLSPALVTRSDMELLWKRAYSTDSSSEEATDTSNNVRQFPAAKRGSQPLNTIGAFIESLNFDGDDIDIDGDDAPVVQLVNEIFSIAVTAGVSDIHIEPCDDGWRLRQRIDGGLREELVADDSMVAALTLRLKLLANLNISERRMPQDGRFSIPVAGRDIDVRLSTMPIQDGESVVMRLLDKGNVPLNLDQVNMEPGLLARFRSLINRPHGLVLVTGPTGSGKTTTLYGALSELNGSDNKIITVEDPVEYQLDRVNQVQVRPKIDLTFARVLRTTLRQDPDILLVGEIRDEETAQIAMRASITGHMVLSTLHTNDAIGSAQRLVDMGVPGYLVGGALSGVMAQRLVRCVCEDCKQSSEANAAQLGSINAILDVPVSSFTLYEGTGCESCNGSGYRGRMAVHELLEIDDELSQLLTANDTHAFAAAASKKESYLPLVSRALEMARQGKTSLAEVEKLSISQVPNVPAQSGDSTPSAASLDIDNLELVANA